METVNYKIVHCRVCGRSSAVPFSSLGWVGGWVCSDHRIIEVDRLAAVQVEVREREAMWCLAPL